VTFLFSLRFVFLALLVISTSIFFFLAVKHDS
jgi:hypothetical protein